MNRSPISVYSQFEGFLEETMFLTTMDEDRNINVMPITFKSLGNLLGDTCIQILVSERRYSCEVLDFGIQEFTLSRGKRLSPLVELCGTSSGRTVDKVKEYGIELLEGKVTQVPVLKQAEISYECKILDSLEEECFMGFKMFIGSVEGVFRHKA
ncbi:flavin reductase [Leptospira idonii]|uniref:Flavin reductase like domain-containing protein n=1 Tax=Leptospira idonii TaxID=1193500 RepID=A0A4R9LXL5_9LEPT|nr:flavin reductase [Leptospira idonii]TGN18422.1 hypothetical protein EHS15_13580 [Leptospira idonii]